jgi:hypothetical protein
MALDVELLAVKLLTPVNASPPAEHRNGWLVDGGWWIVGVSGPTTCM